MAKKGGNPENLKAPRSTNEARMRGANGGKKSGEVRREKKRLREAMETLLEKKDSDGEDGYAKVVFSLYKTAIAGDSAGVSAFNAIRDLVGEKPTDKIQLGGEDSELTQINITFGDKSKRKNHVEKDPIIVDGGALKDDIEG